MTLEEGTLLYKKVLAGEVTEADFVAQIKNIAPDMAVTLIKNYGEEKSGGQMTAYFREFTNNYPDFVQYLKDQISLKPKV